MAHDESSPEVEAPRGRHRITLLDLIVVIVVILFLLMLLFPSVSGPREAGRRASCMNHEKVIGLGLQNYASAFQALPSACYAAMPDGQIRGRPGGFSFLVRILPFLEYDTLYKSLDVGDDPFNPSNATTRQATYNVNSVSIKEYTCPANPNQVFLAPQKLPPWTALNQSWAVTNYVALGASCPQSLNLAINPQATPPYGLAKQHPDGVIYPCAGNNGSRFADIPDGTSHTICVCETIDHIATAWTVGLDCVMTGMADKGPAGYVNSKYPFVCDPAFDMTFGNGSPVYRKAAADKTGLLWPFIHMDFSSTGKERTFYQKYGLAPHYSPLPPGALGPVEDMFGPSSPHSTTVSCLFVDGSVQSINKDIDPMNWFFLITKATNDPFYVP